MTDSNLTRDTARARAAAIDLDSIEAWLDLTSAPDADEPLFGTRTTLRFASSADALGIDLLDAGDRPRRQKRSHGRPIVGRAVGQA